MIKFIENATFFRLCASGNLICLRDLSIEAITVGTGKEKSDCSCLTALAAESFCDLSIQRLNST
jgi:hypothetical protein